MKSVSRIRMDFRKTVRLAERLEDIGKDLKNMGGEEGAEAFKTELFWEGEAASAWNRVGIDTMQQVLETRERLTGTASALHAAAQRIYEAEMRAYRLAKERTYEI